MTHADVDLANPPRRRFGCVTLVRNKAGEVLLVKQNYDDHKWILPGGGAHADEDLVAAARRELKEETGLDLPLTHVIAVDQIPFNPKNGVIEGVNFVFDGGVLSDTAASAVRIPPGVAHELSEYAWVNPSQLGDWVWPYQSGRILQAISASEAGAGIPMLFRGVPQS